MGGSGTRLPSGARRPAEGSGACGDRGARLGPALSPGPLPQRAAPGRMAQGPPPARPGGSGHPRSPSSCRPFRVGGEKVILLSASAWGFITAATPLLTHLSSAHLVCVTFSRILTGLLQGRVPRPDAGVCVCTRALACACSCGAGC